MSENRYRLTGHVPKSLPALAHDLGNGWTTTSVVIEAARIAGHAHLDSAFTFAEVITAARTFMGERALVFTGETSDHDRYTDDADRVVNGRFGDLHRSGVFEAVS